jgi:hypothetical protein
MATSAEFTFLRAVALAEQTRQLAKTAAFNTWAFGTGAALTTYTAALEAADNAYIASVNAAASTLAGFGISVPNAGPASQAPVVTSGNLGQGGPSAGITGSLSTTFGSVAA